MLTGAECFEVAACKYSTQEPRKPMSLVPDGPRERRGEAPPDDASWRGGGAWSNLSKLREGVVLVKLLPERFAAAMGIRLADAPSNADPPSTRSGTARSTAEEETPRSGASGDPFAAAAPPGEELPGDLPGQLPEPDEERCARRIEGLQMQHWSRLMLEAPPGHLPAVAGNAAGQLLTWGAFGQALHLAPAAFQERCARILRARIPTKPVLDAWGTVRLNQENCYEAALVGSSMWAYFPYPHDIDSLERVCVQAVSRRDAACQIAEMLKSVARKARSRAVLVELKAGLNSAWHSLAQMALDPESLSHSQVSGLDASLTELRDEIFRLPRDSVERQRAVRLFKHKLRVVKWSGRDLLKEQPEMALPGEQLLSLPQALEYSEIVKLDAICLIDGVLTEVSNMVLCQWHTSADEEPQALSTTFVAVEDLLDMYLKGLKTNMVLSKPCKSIKRVAALLRRLLAGAEHGVSFAVQERALSELDRLQGILASDIGRFSQIAEMADTLRKVMAYRASGSLEVPFSKQDMVGHLRLLLRDISGALHYPINLSGSLASAFLRAGHQFLDCDGKEDVLLDALNQLCPALRVCTADAATCRLSVVGRDLASLMAIAEDLVSQVPLDAEVRRPQRGSAWRMQWSDTYTSVQVHGVTGDPDEA